MSLGRLFLDKIIQLPIHIPPSTEEGIDELVNTITEYKTRPIQGKSSTQNASQKKLIEAAEVLQIKHSPKLEPTPLVAQSEQKDVASYTREDIREAIRVGARLLTENPRQVKRFINLFRLYVYVVNAQGMFEEDGQMGVTVKRLAIWVAWSIRWEEIVRYLSEDRRLFESELVSYLLMASQYLQKNGCWKDSAQDIKGHGQDNTGTSDSLLSSPYYNLTQKLYRVRKEEKNIFSHWCLLPWEQWFRDPAFLTCIKELESLWQQPQQGKTNWLQIMLQMSRYR